MSWRWSDSYFLLFLTIDVNIFWYLECQLFDNLHCILALGFFLCYLKTKLHDLVQNKAYHLTTTSSLSSCGYFSQSKYLVRRQWKPGGREGREGGEGEKWQKIRIMKTSGSQHEQWILKIMFLGGREYLIYDHLKTLNILFSEIFTSMTILLSKY